MIKKENEKVAEVPTKRAPLSSFLPKPKWSEEIDLDDLEVDTSVDEKIESSEPPPTVTDVPDSSTEASQPIVSTSTELPPYSNNDYTTSSSEEPRHCSFYRKLVVYFNGKKVMKLERIPTPNSYYCDSINYHQPDVQRE